jgi:fructose/tagatose bisphosphate aldolase
VPERGLAINVSSSTLNAAIRGFVTAGSDGIVQMSQGGAELATGTQMIQPLGIDELGRGERSHYLLSAPLGHAHGRYQGGNVALRPSVLGEIQRSPPAATSEPHSISSPTAAPARRRTRSPRQPATGSSR